MKENLQTLITHCVFNLKQQRVCTSCKVQVLRRNKKSVCKIGDKCRKKYFTCRTKKLVILYIASFISLYWNGAYRIFSIQIERKIRNHSQAYFCAARETKVINFNISKREGYVGICVVRRTKYKEHGSVSNYSEIQLGN